MTLSAVLNSLEDLDETLHGLYKEVDGKFILDLDGLDDHPTTKGMKVVLEDQKKKTKSEHAKAVAAAEALKAFDDLDPEAAREALLKVQEFDDGKRMEQGEFKQLLEDRIAEVTTKIEKQMGAKVADLQATNATLTTERDGAITSLARHKVGDAITQASLLGGVKKTLLRHLQRDALEVFSVRDDEIGAWDADDIPLTDSKGALLTPETYVTDYLAENPDFGEPNKGSGSPGAGDRGKGGAGAPRLISPEQSGDFIEDIADGKAIIQE